MFCFDSEDNSKFSQPGADLKYQFSMVGGSLKNACALKVCMFLKKSAIPCIVSGSTLFVFLHQNSFIVFENYCDQLCPPHSDVENPSFKYTLKISRQKWFPIPVQLNEN